MLVGLRTSWKVTRWFVCCCTPLRLNMYLTKLLKKLLWFNFRLIIWLNFFCISLVVNTIYSHLKKLLKLLKLLIQFLVLFLVFPSCNSLQMLIFRCCCCCGCCSIYLGRFYFGLFGGGTCTMLLPLNTFRRRHHHHLHQQHPPTWFSLCFFVRLTSTTNYNYS